MFLFEKSMCESLAHSSLVLTELLPDPAWTELLHFLHSGKSLAVLTMKGPALSTQFISNKCHL